MTYITHQLSRAQELIEPSTGKAEKSLLFRYLEQAILDMVDAKKQIREGAKEWIFKDESEEKPRPFSFLWTCYNLNIDSTYLQAELRKVPPTFRKRHIRKRIINYDVQNPIDNLVLHLKALKEFNDCSF